MTSQIVSRSSTATRRVMARPRWGIVEAILRLAKELFDPYRPERHYMRGPGPKWRAKHARPAAAVRYGHGELIPAVIRVPGKRP